MSFPPPTPLQQQFSGVVEFGGRHQPYSRKEKSLGLLCSNFVFLYNRKDVEEVGLDEAALSLGVERRRIYDIVNVLESVGVLARKAKNKYTWIGFSGIPKALQHLKEQALRESSSTSPAESAVKVSDDLEDNTSLDTPLDNEKSSLGNMSVEGVSSLKAKSDQRKEKSLSLLTQNFVKLFLNSEVDIVSLEDAARLLLGDAPDSTTMRTKVRRLYDIANVLSSLNLIEKTQQPEKRKPAFRWLGSTEVKSNESEVTVAGSSTVSQTNKRAFGTDITNMYLKKSKTISTVKEMRPLQLRDDSLNKSVKVQKPSTVLKGSFVFGPFQPVSVHKRETDGKKSADVFHEWESLAASFRPQYQNKALNNLFRHYVNAWKSWCSQSNEGSGKPVEQPR